MSDKWIIAQEQNYRKALALVAAGRVEPNGTAGQFYVKDTDFDGHLFRTTSSVDWCGCPTFHNSGHKAPVTRCQHMIAAELFERAQGFIRAWIHRHQSTLQHLVSIAHLQLEYAKSDLTAEKYQVVIAVAKKMIVTDRHLSKRYPASLDMVQQLIQQHQESIASIRTRLRREPTNRVTQEELRYCNDVLIELKSQKARIVKGWTKS